MLRSIWKAKADEGKLKAQEQREKEREKQNQKLESKSGNLGLGGIDELKARLEKRLQSSSIKLPEVNIEDIIEAD